jgi:hypothetical protein
MHPSCVSHLPRRCTSPFGMQGGPCGVPSPALLAITQRHHTQQPRAIELASPHHAVDTQNCPEGIIDIIIMFLSSRWPESILGSSHLALGRRKWHFGCWTSQSRLSRLPKLADFTNLLKCKNGLHHCVPLVELIEKYMWFAWFGVRVN